MNNFHEREGGEYMASNPSLKANIPYHIPYQVRANRSQKSKHFTMFFECLEPRYFGWTHRGVQNVFIKLAFQGLLPKHWRRVSGIFLWASYSELFSIPLLWKKSPASNETTSEHYEENKKQLWPLVTKLLAASYPAHGIPLNHHWLKAQLLVSSVAIIGPLLKKLSSPNTMGVSGILPPSNAVGVDITEYSLIYCILQPDIFSLDSPVVSWIATKALYNLWPLYLDCLSLYEPLQLLALRRTFWLCLTLELHRGRVVS